MIRKMGIIRIAFRILPLLHLFHFSFAATGGWVHRKVSWQLKSFTKCMLKIPLLLSFLAQDISGTWQTFISTRISPQEGHRPYWKAIRMSGSTSLANTSTISAGPMEARAFTATTIATPHWSWSTLQSTLSRPTRSWRSPTVPRSSSYGLGEQKYQLKKLLEILIFYNVRQRRHFPCRERVLFRGCRHRRHPDRDGRTGSDRAAGLSSPRESRLSPQEPNPAESGGFHLHGNIPDVATLVANRSVEGIHSIRWGNTAFSISR